MEGRLFATYNLFATHKQVICWIGKPVRVSGMGGRYSLYIINTLLIGIITLYLW